MSLSEVDDFIQEEQPLRGLDGSKRAKEIHEILLQFIDLPYAEWTEDIDDESLDAISTNTNIESFKAESLTAKKEKEADDTFNEDTIDGGSNEAREAIPDIG